MIEKEKSYSELYEELATDMKAVLRSEDITLTQLVREGLTISTAINFATRDVKEYNRFMAYNVYEVCSIIDKLKKTNTFKKRFQNIFDDKYTLLNRWSKELRETPNISSYALGNYRLKRFTRKNKYRYGTGTMLKILDEAQKYERGEQK